MAHHSSISGHVKVPRECWQSLPRMQTTPAAPRGHAGTQSNPTKTCLNPDTCNPRPAGHSDAVRALSVANGRLFSGSYDGTVRVWDIETLACLRTLAGHTGPVRTLVYSAGHMFSGSYDKTVGPADVFWQADEKDIWCIKA